MVGIPKDADGRVVHRRESLVLVARSVTGHLDRQMDR